MANVINKSPITYYGGKTAILPYLIDMVPVHTCYTEVFFGGGALFFQKAPAKSETINDRLDVVVNFYRVLKLQFKPLKSLIDASLISRTIHNKANNILRAHKYGVEIDPVQLAWAFWLCSNFSHMHKLIGGFKQDKGGGRSVAQELQRKKLLFTDHLVARIENATIENDHWLTVANARNSPDAFHYLDPPYPGTHQGAHHKFTWADMDELFEWCLNECKGKFLLSNYNSDHLTAFIRSGKFHKREITHELKQARKGGLQTHRTEVLVSNYKSACGTIELFNQPSQVPGAAPSL